MWQSLPVLTVNAGAEQSERLVWSWMRQTAAVHGLSAPREQTHPGRQTLVWSITWSRKVQRLPKDVNTGARRTKTLTRIVDELLRQAHNESSNEMACMSIEVGCKKTSRLVSSSQGVPEVPTAEGISRISSITEETRCTELFGDASRRLFATRASGAA